MADAILIAHAAFVAFVVVGLILILAGGWRGWRWIRHPWFRIAHLAAIALVVLQAWLGVICPLTTLESYFRQRAGEPAYEGSFIEHWLGELIFYEAPAWVFTLVYTGFGLLVVLSWIFVRPRPVRRRTSTDLTA